MLNYRDLHKIYYDVLIDPLRKEVVLQAIYDHKALFSPKSETLPDETTLKADIALFVTQAFETLIDLPNTFCKYPITGSFTQIDTDTCAGVITSKLKYAFNEWFYIKEKYEIGKVSSQKTRTDVFGHDINANVESTYDGNKTESSMNSSNDIFYNPMYDLIKNVCNEINKELSNSTWTLELLEE